MPTKAHCISCEQPYSQRRKELGYNFCLDCGEYQATKQRAGWTIAPILELYLSRTSKALDSKSIEALEGLNKNTQEI